MTFQSRHLSVSIDRPLGEVYDFLATPENWPTWAPGLGTSIAKLNGEWVAESPMGRIKVAFVERNRFGILDHDVTLPSGETVRNHFRAVPNGDGCELVFTLFQRAGMSEEMFAEDAKAVTRDLEQLKTILES
jgi:hypothetical protein